MRPCPNCECFVVETVRRCPRCAAALEPIAPIAPIAPPEPVVAKVEHRELALVGAASAALTTTDPIVRSVMARVVLAPIDVPGPRRPGGLPKLPQPFASDPLVLAVFLGIPMRAADPAPAPTDETTLPPVARVHDEPAADLSPATITAIMDAAAEIATGGVSAQWSPRVDSPPDAALERVIARANALAEHVPTVDALPTEAVAPAPPESPPANDEDLRRALELAAAAAAADAVDAPDTNDVLDDLLATATMAPPEPQPEAEVEPQPDVETAPETAVALEPEPSPIAATPIAAPVVLTVPDRAPKARRRRWFGHRDPFARPMTKRERILARTCMWLVVALACSILALRLPIGSRPRLGASTNSDGPALGTPQTPVTTPFADAIRLQTRADLQVVVAAASHIYPLLNTFETASPALLGHQMPQFAFVAGNEPSVRVGELSVASTVHEITFSEYAGPKGCAYARLILHRPAEVFIGATHRACRATTPAGTGWSALGTD